MNRRGFMATMLAACAAPAIVRAESLMRIVPYVPEALIVPPFQVIYQPGQVFIAGTYTLSAFVKYGGEPYKRVAKTIDHPGGVLAIKLDTPRVADGESFGVDGIQLEITPKQQDRVGRNLLRNSHT